MRYRRSACKFAVDYSANRADPGRRNGHTTSITASPSPSTVKTARWPLAIETVGYQAAGDDAHTRFEPAAAFGDMVGEPGQGRARICLHPQFCRRSRDGGECRRGYRPAGLWARRSRCRRSSNSPRSATRPRPSGNPHCDPRSARRRPSPPPPSRASTARPKPASRRRAISLSMRKFDEIRALERRRRGMHVFLREAGQRGGTHGSGRTHGIRLTR